MIDQLHLVFCCGRDDRFLKPFKLAWQKVWGGTGAKLVLADDVNDQTSPFRAGYMASVPSRWRNGPELPNLVLNTMLGALRVHPARWLFKHDVDCLHIRNSWFDGDGDLIGAESLRGKTSGVYGGSYAIRAEVVKDVQGCGDWFCDLEDIAISTKARERGWRVKAHPIADESKRVARGLKALGGDISKASDNVGWIHYGEGGKTLEQRREQAQRMLEDCRLTLTMV